MKHLLSAPSQPYSIFPLHPQLSVPVSTAPRSFSPPPPFLPPTPFHAPDWCSWLSGRGARCAETCRYGLLLMMTQCRSDELRFHVATWCQSCQRLTRRCRRRLANPHGGTGMWQTNERRTTATSPYKLHAIARPYGSLFLAWQNRRLCVTTPFMLWSQCWFPRSHRTRQKDEYFLYLHVLKRVLQHARSNMCHGIEIFTFFNLIGYMLYISK